MFPLSQAAEECAHNDQLYEDTVFTRADANTLVFLSLHSFFMLIRLYALIYFIREAKHHYHAQKEYRDPYTFMTFLLLGISSICLFVARLVYMIRNIVVIVGGDSEYIKDQFCYA
jgi:hypothetical protein